MYSASITILLPCYNSSATIKKCLISLKSQTFSNFICFLLDNCSQDNTLQKIQSVVGDDARFCLSSNSSNQGAPHSFFYLLERVTTQYVMYLASDDYLDPGCLRHLYLELQANPKTICASPKTQRFRYDGFESVSDGTYSIVANNAFVRQWKYFLRLTDNSRFYGLYRFSCLRYCNVLMNFFAADLVMTGLTLGYGNHVEVASESSSPLLYRELPAGMSKYWTKDWSLKESFLEKSMLILTPFGSGIKCLFRYLTPLRFCALLPVLILINFRLSYCVVRAMLASNRRLRSIYLSFSRAFSLHHS